MNLSSPNYHLNGEFYFTNKSGQVFSFQLTSTPTLSISMSEEKLQNGNEGDKTTQITNKEMTSMNEAISFIVQLVHQKTLEGYTLVDTPKREQNKELSIKNDNISEMPLEISSNPSEGSLSPCNVPSKSPSSQTEYLLVSEKDSKSDGKSASDEFELIERKESEECKDFGQENASMVPNILGGQAFKIIDLEQEDIDDNIRYMSCSSPKQDMYTEEVSISTFHRVNKEAILKKAEELNIKCDFRYYMMIISGLSQNVAEFKNYLYQVEVTTKEALYPKYWDLKDTNMYSEIEVAHDSKEFEEIASLVTKYFVRAQVLKLVRVQNNYLMTHYISNLNMRQEVSEGKLDRKLLFHGTNQVEPSKIYKSFDTGFDIQYAKEGSMFGKGLYFAQHASYSHAFAFPVNVKEGKYQLLLADVFVGKTYKGLELNKLKPPEGFDSMSPGNGFYIICNNFHSYPLYLIEYTMQKKPVRPASPPPLKRIDKLSAIIPRGTEVHKLNFTPIDTSANTNMNYLAPPPLQVPDELHKAQKLLEDMQKALKKDETETKLEKIKELKTSQMTRISHLEKVSSNSFSPFNYVFDKILSGSKLNRPPIYNNQLSVSALNRSKKDIIEIQTDTSLDFLFVEQPDETDLSKCVLCLIGPPYSAYEGGIFRIELTFPDDYPLNPPLVSFKTKIYHPCIDDAGNICLGLLSQWTPSGSVKQIGLLISAVLDNPLLEEPLLPYILSQYETNRQSFVSQARSFTQKYAE